MTEYIEREAALSAVDCGNLHKGIVDALQENIKDIPAADVVEVRHGGWVLAATDIPTAFEKWNVWACSECGCKCKAGWEHTEEGRMPRAKDFVRQAIAEGSDPVEFLENVPTADCPARCVEYAKTSMSGTPMRYVAGVGISFARKEVKSDGETNSCSK